MRDPHGWTHFEGEWVRRTLAAPLPVDHFLHSDLAIRLANDGRLVAFEQTGTTELTSPRLPFVTQPAEWCDAQLHAAGRLTLDLQCEAVSAGFDLKDASAWNVIFDGCRPMFCDLLSFAPLRERRWWAMGQYARHFLFPLLSSRRRGMKAHEVFGVWRDGMSASTARRLLGRSLYLTRYGTLLLGQAAPLGLAHSAVPAAAPRESPTSGSVEPFRNRLHASLDWMLAGVAPATLPSMADNGWAGYEQDRPHYCGDSLERKRNTVAEWLVRVKPSWVLDLGCNTGEFSRMAAERGAEVVPLDADHDSVERLYRSAPPNARLHPVVAPLDDIAGGRGWAGAEHPGLASRMSQRFDLVMMLALVHHVAIGAAIPLRAIAEFVRACSRGWAIVEFLDASDPQLVSLCQQRQRLPQEFTIERQRAAFLDAGFRLESEVALTPTERSLALLRAVR